MAYNKLNCIMIISDTIRKSLRTNVTNLVNYGVEIVTDLRDITEQMLDITRRVVILGFYKESGLEDLRLYKEILNLEYYFISDDKVYTSLMKKLGKTFLMDYTKISSNMLSAVLYEDSGEVLKYSIPDTHLSSRDRLKNILGKSEDPTIKEFGEQFFILYDLLEMKIKDENNNLAKIRKLESEILQHLSEIDLIKHSYSNLVSKTLEQSSALKDYSIILSQDLYEKVSVTDYKKRPKIIYLKEYQPLIHEKSFILTLFKMIRLQANLSCKVLRLHDSDDILRIKTLEDDYTILGDKYLESDIVNEDFLLTYGGYKNLLDVLLTNKEDLDVLIIFDCKKYEATILNAPDMAYFSICRNKNNIEKFGLDLSNTITNSSGCLLSWETYKKFNSLGENDLVEYLTSRPIMRRLYTIIKEL